MTKSTLDHRLRHARAGDLDCILGCWIDSMRRMRPWSSTEPSWFCSAQRALIRELLACCTTLLAVNPSDDGHIFGYAVGSPEWRVLHWCYVKDAFRQSGVGTSLMRGMFGSVGPEAPPVKLAIKTVASPHYMQRWNLVYEPHSLVDMLK